MQDLARRDPFRPPVPAGCSKEVLGLIRKCWAPEPAERPAFAALHRQIRVLQPVALRSTAIGGGKRGGQRGLHRGSGGRAGEVGQEAVLRQMFPGHVVEALLRGEKVSWNVSELTGKGVRAPFFCMFPSQAASGPFGISACSIAACACGEG